MTRWYRAYEGTCTDAKLGEVAMIADCSRSVAIAAWHCLLENCAGLNEGGRFDLTARRLAVILGEPLQKMSDVLNAFEEIALTQGGVVVAWAARQFESDSDPTNALRQKRFRDKRRNAAVTPANAHETADNAHETLDDNGSNGGVTRYANDHRQRQSTETEGVKPPNPLNVPDEGVQRAVARALIAEERQERKRQKAAALNADFECFWRAYPKRSGDNPKNPALLKFIAAVAKGADPSLIIAGAVAYAATRVGQDPAYTKQAVTWLNQRCWEDDHAPARPFNPEPRNPARDERTPLTRAFDNIRARLAEGAARDRGGPGEDGYPMLDLTPVAS